MSSSPAPSSRPFLTRVPRLVLVLALALALAGVVRAAPAAQAATAAGHDQIVSAAPGVTPAINNGEVDAIAQVGGVMVVGGTFTTVTPVGGSATTRNYVMAFDTATGALVPGFNPTLNGIVNEVIPGPTAGTVYLAGAFTTVNGAAQSHLTLVSTTTGAVVSGFKPASTNGLVNTLVQRGNRLYVGGNFTTAGGVAHGGLASMNATTGALDAYVSNQVAQRHNDTGSGAQGAVGVRDLDLNADGTRLVAIGNFKRVDGLSRDQVVLLTLGASSSTVTADWQTNRYSPYCFNWAFDTYVRGVSFSPDGSYFVVAATGGYVANTLCDAAARFETSASSLDVQPTWVNYSGGDTLWGVTVTEKAVYVGGHQRWLNNSLASDTAGPGAVPRPGLAALDVNTGVPLKWNPGRNPRGAAVYALLATPTGLWMGSDTEYIGNRYQYKRPRLAFFPLASGAPEASDATAGLPGTAYVGASTASSDGNILYRVNAGGGTVGAVDNGPDWTADDGGDSSYRNSGSNSAGYGSGAATDGTVPSSTPNAVFDSERWSPSDNPAMNWAFPAPAGAPVQVRLYFANRCSCTGAAGQRSFDVSLDGTKVLDNFDIVGQTGDQRGTMRSFDLTSDGTVNIDFAHRVENPLVNAIEIVRTDQAPPAGDVNSLSTARVTTTGAEPAAPTDVAGVDWTQVRGSFVAGGKLWYGTRDNSFASRTYADGSFGPEVRIDPYNDPAWAGVDTGSGNTFDGNPVDLYPQFSSVTGMAYADGRLYYVRSGDSNLYWRWFNTDSGIIGASTFTANGGRDWRGTLGMFAADGKLYFATKADGNLNSVTLGQNGPTGVPVVVDSPSAGGNDWRSRALFLVVGNQVPANAPPKAAFSPSCTDLTCQADASASSDPDGSVTAYSWSFGDGSDPVTGQVASHTYADPGTYTITLTVTDDKGATDSATRSVTVSRPSQTNPIAYVDSASRSGNSASLAVTVPATVAAGDTLVLTASMGNATSGTAPSGWTRVGDETNTSALRSGVWVRRATASDAGSPVTVTMEATHKIALSVTAYRGVDASTPISSSSFSSESNTASHTTPAVTVPAGSWVVSVWNDKSSNTAWSVPGSVKLRTAAYTAGGGSVTEAVADSDGARTGAVDGTTATATASGSRALSWSLVLAPASGGTPPANTPPKAAFTDACTGLTCQLDAGSSTDADGTVTSWTWSFGDGAGDQGATVGHTYANAGTYDVRLVVTDDRGATDTLTRSVTVTTPSQGSTVAYVDSATRSGNLVAPAVTVPGGTQAGDTLVLNATMGNATSAQAPAGWTRIGEEAGSSTVRSTVWVRTATSGDAGSQVAVTMDAIHKAALTLSVYRGVATGQVAATSATDASTTSHTTPGVTVPPGAWVLSVWGDKGATTAWTTPASVTGRSQVYNSGGGAVSQAAADSGGPRSGAVAGTTATTDASSARAVSWSIVLPSQ